MSPDKSPPPDRLRIEETVLNLMRFFSLYETSLTRSKQGWHSPITNYNKLSNPDYYVIHSKYLSADLKAAYYTLLLVDYYYYTQFTLYSIISYHYTHILSLYSIYSLYYTFFIFIIRYIFYFVFLWSFVTIVVLIRMNRESVGTSGKPDDGKTIPSGKFVS